jgi:NAD(P)-dependent dehydrogenase (short-subunit alcohol dehydrogenase family)
MTRHYVVVGGSRGLGRAFAEAAVRSGHVVSTIGRSLTDALEGGQFPCDLTRADQTADVLDVIRRDQGEIDAIAFFQRFRGPGDDWEGEWQTSLTATKTLIEHSVPHFAANGLKSIVAVSSVNAEFISPKLPPGYHLAKAGIVQLAKYYACKLGPQGIRVNAVCPSTFVKPENEAFYESHPEIVTRLAKLSPLNRMATYRDVVDVIFFLLSERSAFVTGQSLTVDGGISLQWHEHMES